MSTRRSKSEPADLTVLPDPLDNRESQLLAIARRLFAQRGFDRTSLRDIAEEARITKAALYYYFPNKDALYERVVVESLQMLVDTISAELARAKTPTERVPRNWNTRPICGFSPHRDCTVPRSLARTAGWVVAPGTEP